MSIPRLWPDSTIVCLGSGPSLTKEDVERVTGRAKLLAVNDTVFDLAPHADAFYTGSLQWWLDHPDFGDEDLPAVKVTVAPQAAKKHPKLILVRSSGERGLEVEDPGAIRTGHHSGYGSVNVAVHLGGTTIVLLGHDMQVGERGEHHYAEHAERPDGAHLAYPARQRVWPTLTVACRQHGITLVNASRRTALIDVPRASLETLFP